MGIFAFFQFLTTLHIVQWEYLYFSVFVNFPCYSIGIEVSGLRRRGRGRTYVRTNGPTRWTNGPKDRQMDKASRD